MTINFNYHQKCDSLKFNASKIYNVYFFSPLIIVSMNKYNKLKLIGKGSYGTVYKIEKKNNNKIYALKQIKVYKLKNNYEINNLINELKILTFHECNYLLKCRDIFYDMHQINIVTDYAKFSDLSSYIEKYKNKNKFINEKTIWMIFIQCCYGIEYLHEFNIIHRDLKPANILLNDNSSILLADFGISKIIENKISSYTMIGTPYYISPEMYNDVNYNKKIDIWSLGCVLYELVTLTVPFRANDINALKKKVIYGNYYNKIPLEYSNDISFMINYLLDKNCNTRPSINQILSNRIFKKYEHLCNLTNNNNFNSSINENLHSKYTLPKIPSKWNLLINEIDKSNINKSPKINKDIPKFSKIDNFDDKVINMNKISDKKLDKLPDKLPSKLPNKVPSKLPQIKKNNEYKSFLKDINVNNHHKLPRLHSNYEYNKKYKSKYDINYYPSYNYYQNYSKNNANYFKRKYNQNYNIINNQKLY